jgi:hypothetical protein
MLSSHKHLANKEKTPHMASQTSDSIDFSLQENNRQPSDVDLKAAAGSYHALGLSVVPFKLTRKETEYEKLNLSNWKKWETEPQTDEECLSLNWDGANAFAVILGTQAKNGLYLTVIDYDCKGDNVTQEVKDKGRELLKEFPITCMEQTVNKGIHLIYWTRTKPKTIGTFHNTASLELLGEKKLCLMAPSLGYSKLNDNSPTELENIEQNFNATMKKHGLLKESIQPSRQPTQARSGPDIPRPCIVEALKCQLTGPNGHLMRLTIAAEYKRLGYSDEEIIDLFRQQADFDSNTCRTQVSSADKEKTATCKSITELGYCLPNCSIKERSTASSGSRTCAECAYYRTPKCSRSNSKKSDSSCDDFYEKTGKVKNAKKIMKDSGATINGYFEAIYNDDKPCFLVIDAGRFHIRESLEIDEETIVPKEARNVPYEPYGYFKEPLPGMNELYNEVRAVLEAYIEVQDPWKDVMTAFVLLSYQQQKLQTVFYILVYGDNESGKSTVLQIFKALCYRPLYGVTIPAADIYGYLDDNDSTGVVLEDEVQGINKDIDKVKIYKAGYKRGATVPRTLITQNDRIIKYYNVFSLKAVASEQLPQVKGFRERFLEIHMTEGYPAKEWSDVKAEDLEQLRQLRNKLLKWRMQTREQSLPDVELKVKGRLKELWKPILQITSGLQIYDCLLKFVEDQQKERMDIKQSTLEGKLVKVVTDLFNESKDTTLSYTFTFPFQLIWNALREELDGKIDEKKPNVMDTSEFFQVTKNKVGYRLREILSGKTKAVRQKDPNGRDVVVKAYDFELVKLRKIAKKYGYELVTKLPMLLSSEGAQAPECPLLPPQSMEKTVEKEGKTNENTPHTQQELSYSSNLVTKEEPQPKDREEDREAANSYSQLTCYFCKKTIMDNDWEESSFSENKPAHKKCCDEKRSQLKQAVEMPDFDDKCQPPEEAS